MPLNLSAKIAVLNALIIETNLTAQYGLIMVCMYKIGTALTYPNKRGPITEYRPTPLIFLLTRIVCMITIKWVWLKSLPVHDCSFEAETQHKTNYRLTSTAVWQVIFQSY